jgi:hypothetical protein
MISCVLEKSKSSMPNMTMTKNELKAMKSLRLNKGTRILQADKGTCVVALVESKHKAKLNILPESGTYEPLPKDSRAKHRNIFLHKTALLTGLKHKLTPYHSMLPHVYHLPKIHRYIPLRHTVS